MRPDAVYKRSLVRVLKWVLSCSEIEKSLIEADSLAARARRRPKSPRGRAARAEHHVYMIKDHESLDTTIRARRGDPWVGVPDSVVPNPPQNATFKFA